MGVACGGSPGAGGGAAGGRVTVTDDDTIEKSNLSRQFLFRDWDIGAPKSTAAAKAALAINPSLALEALQNRVSPETEGVFNDAFWGGLDLVVNALDNVSARLYVDARCVYFGKPLLESGTLGPKCNTQAVIPRLTENYGASRDPPEKQAPMCTVHSFPHNIDHCLTWARSEFEGLFEKSPSEANAYLEDPAKYVDAVRTGGDAASREQLARVAEALAAEHVASFEECVAWARRRFQDYFHDRVAQLTFTFPEDSTTSTGAPFWSAPKRFPRALDFSGADASHAALLQAAAILKAQVYGVALPPWATDAAAVVASAATVHVPPFAPKSGVTIETDPKAKAAAVVHVDDAAVIEGLVATLDGARARLPAAFRLAPVTFEKDDDTNYHMDVIAGLANMRARNYSVPEVDKLKARARCSPRALFGVLLCGRPEPLRERRQSAGARRSAGSPLSPPSPPLTPAGQADRGAHHPRHRHRHRAGHGPGVPGAVQGAARGEGCGGPRGRAAALGFPSSAPADLPPPPLPAAAAHDRAPWCCRAHPSPIRPNTPHQNHKKKPAVQVVLNKPLEAYRNTFANLALPLFAMAEPIAPKPFKFRELAWTLWDRWVLEGDFTIREVLAWFEARGLRAYSISCGASLLYNDIFPKHKERLDKRMSELVVTVAKQSVPEWRAHFDVVVACEDEEGEDLDVPLVSIKFR